MDSQPSRFLTLGLLFFFLTLCRTKAETPNNLSLYQRSLQAYVEAKAELGSTDDAILVLDNDVVHDLFAARLFPAKIGSHTIECLNNKSIKDRYKKTGKQFRVVEVSPMRSQGNNLIVECREYGVSARGGKVILGVYGGYQIEWRFDCSKGEYVKTGVAPLFLRM